MLKIAVLGCGRIGRMHAENIHAHPRAELAGVFDVFAPAASEVSQKLGVTNFASAEDVFASENVDAVLIATSTPTHADFIEQAVAAGKPILCEKPIDLSLDRVNVCARNISGSELPIMLGFVRRFDPGHRAVRLAIEAGQIGDLHQVVITSRDPGMAPDAYMEASGGIFRDMTIHDFDMARFILGEEVTEVFATGSRLVNPALMERLNDWDTVSVVLTTASGKQCIINNSRKATYGYDQRVEAFGSEGMAVSENRRPHMTTLHRGDFTGQGAPLLNFFIDRYAEAFAAEIDAFVDTIENRVAPDVGFEDGRQALVLAEAALKSVIECRPVKTSELG
ncbi:inositol 2-dehydrogenase [Marinobacterium nitratireducens]|uniref:Inositol 2-dehydrogenase n=1 Tax=Marinobacterium nitratireducens TaxID=518897 RepID=A0A917ZLF4_9GAMM|nr:inositol 2-dehydrogenase [Marinobacterium nitratireducens]GGO84360.1 inositol 2-dehydrogenase [Marinobacterium nitratireducens]